MDEFFCSLGMDSFSTGVVLPPRHNSGRRHVRLFLSEKEKEERRGGSKGRVGQDAFFARQGSKGRPVAAENEGKDGRQDDAKR